MTKEFLDIESAIDYGRKERGKNNMDTQKIAKILFYMSLDMDYADALESANEEIDCITRDLEFLKQNGRDVILQALEMIALENESILEKYKNN